ncbi:MAG: hypothetical protein EOP56_02685 [Sphingobacteriales bacterium]|nr:MAG: hypothetical protein EOP56_02685 [Sphingobacteriales bacterium]
MASNDKQIQFRKLWKSLQFRRLLLLMGCCLSLTLFRTVMVNQEPVVARYKWGNIQLLNIHQKTQERFSRPPPSLTAFKRLLDSLDTLPDSNAAKNTLLDGREGLVDSFRSVWALYNNY